MDSFPTQESIRRFLGFIADSAVLEQAGGRGRPRPQSRAIFGTVIDDSRFANMLR
jgi:hypothetical protein